jgi:hypothetical protein
MVNAEIWPEKRLCAVLTLSTNQRALPQAFYRKQKTRWLNDKKENPGLGVLVTQCACKSNSQLITDIST